MATKKLTRHFARAFQAPRSHEDFDVEMKSRAHSGKAGVSLSINHPKYPKARVGRLKRVRSDANKADHSRRVVVKVSWHSRDKSRDGKARAPGQYRGTLKSHMRYLNREKAGEKGERADFFNRDQDGVDGLAFADKMADDHRHYRLIISPNDGDKIGDFKGYVRDIMKRSEEDLGTKLDWVAVVHEKHDKAHSENRHAHVALRAVSDKGRELIINNDYVKTGFRDNAQREATKRLGLMNAREMAAYREQIITQKRLREQEKEQQPELKKTRKPLSINTLAL